MRETDETSQRSPPPEPAPPRRLPMPVRLVVTLLAALGVPLLSQIPLPWVDAADLPLGLDGQPPAISAFALGITPVLLAYLLVELAAAVVPRWARLRHAGPQGRAALERATALVALALAALQAFALARAVIFTWLVSDAVIGATLTLTAGTFFLWALAGAVTRYGVGNGLTLLLIVTELSGLGSVIGASMGFVPTNPWFDIEPASPIRLAGVLAAACAVCAATWLTAGVDGRAAGAGQGPGRPGTPVLAPASGILPLSLTASILGVVARTWPDTYSSLWPANPWIALFATLSLTLLLGVALGYLFHQPGRVAAVLPQAGAGARGQAIHAAGRALRAGLVPTLAYLAVVLVAERLASALLLQTASLAGVALLTAYVLDAAREVVAHRRDATLTAVWSEHRLYALPAVREALSSRGIAWHARGVAPRALLRIAGAFAPVEILVPARDAARARRALEDALTGDAVARAFGEAEPAGETRPPEEIATEPSGRRRVLILGAVTAGLLAGLGLVLQGSAPAGEPSAADRAARAALLQLVAIDDEADPLAAIAREHRDDWPRGVDIMQENAPVGPGKTAPRHYARAISQPGEALDATAARVAPWLAQIAVPPGARFVFGEMVEVDPDTMTTSTIGLRTYLLRGEPVITGADVVGARAMPSADGPESAYVRVDLSPEGGELFRRFTAEHVKRRLAIVVGGRVASAPVIQSEIPGGIVSITMGAGEPATQIADAKRLARALGGR